MSEKPSLTYRETINDAKAVFDTLTRYDQTDKCEMSKIIGTIIGITSVALTTTYRRTGLSKAHVVDMFHP